MWKPIIRCSIVGGIIVFLWMMLSWAIFPMHKACLNNFTDESEVTSCITRYAPKDGIYVLPSWNKVGGAEKKHPPFIFMNIRRGIDYSNMINNIIYGVITQIIGAAFITFLLLKAKAMKYWGRVWFVTIVGLIVAVLGTIPTWNWWHFPTGWAILEMFDIVVGWFLGGLVIAKLVKN
jgi:hypothetical protein